MYLLLSQGPTEERGSRIINPCPFLLAPRSVVHARPILCTLVALVLCFRTPVYSSPHVFVSQRTQWTRRIRCISSSTETADVGPAPPAAASKKKKKTLRVQSSERSVEAQPLSNVLLDPQPEKTSFFQRRSLEILLPRWWGGGMVTVVSLRNPGRFLASKAVSTYIHEADRSVCEPVHGVN